MPRAVSKCPQCGSAVSQFAAGCAICGADLELARSRASSRRQLSLPRPTLPSRTGAGRGGLTIDWMHVAIAFVIAVFVPPVGFLLALYWAYQRYHTGETAMVVAMLGAAALAAVAFLAPVWFWSHLLHV